MYYKSGQGLEGLGPATLLATNSQHCWISHVASVCTRCCMLLRKVCNWSNFSANDSQHFFCSMITKAKRNNVRSISTTLPTLLGSCTLITHGYWDLWVVFFPQCTAGPKLVGSCCIHLHTTANMHGTTLNIIGPTMWQRRWPWGNQTQLLNVCHWVPFLLPTSLWIHSSLLAPHGEGQLFSSIFHLIVTDCCLLTVNMYFICRFSDALSYMMSCKMKNRSSFGYYNSIYSSANGQKLANISNYRYKFILFLVKIGKIDQALNVITMPPSAILPNDVLNTTSKGKIFSGCLQEMVVDQCRFLANWPPTPPLSHHFALSGK